jgi:hypothetical protein
MATVPRGQANAPSTQKPVVGGDGAGSIRRYTALDSADASPTRRHAA